MTGRKEISNTCPFSQQSYNLVPVPSKLHAFYNDTKKNDKIS